MPIGSSDGTVDHQGPCCGASDSQEPYSYVYPLSLNASVSFVIYFSSRSLVSLLDRSFATVQMDCHLHLQVWFKFKHALPSKPAVLTMRCDTAIVVLVRHIQFLELPEAFAEQAGVLHTPQFMSNFSKLRMWEFCDEYDKLVYLDSDVIPMQNIDDMFMAPHFSASQDNMVPDEGFDAERCQAPSLHMKAPWQTKSAYFNAGVFVFEPSLEELSEIMKTLKYSKLTRYAEQDLLNEFYAGRWNMLPMSYNWGRVNFFVNPEVCPPAALKIVHFSGPAKPWRRHADGSWPEEVYGQVVIGNEKLAMKDRESPFNLAVDRRVRDRDFRPLGDLLNSLKPTKTLLPEWVIDSILMHMAGATVPIRIYHLHTSAYMYIFTLRIIVDR